MDLGAATVSVYDTDTARAAALVADLMLHYGAARCRLADSLPEAILAAAGVVLPQPNAPVANYVPFVRVGELVHISGQVSLDASGGVKGVVGEDVDEVEDLQARAGDLDGDGDGLRHRPGS